MLDPRHFMRMARWVRRPPSMQRVKLMVFVALVIAVIASIEAMGLWPDWATAERLRFRP